MDKTVIIIPSRLAAKRLPNKPILKIGSKPMIIHVLDKAKKSDIGEVYVATPDRKVIEVVEGHGGKAILTSKNHLSGSDRVHEVFSKFLKEEFDIIINLQGDMPNLKPYSLIKLNSFMKNNDCDIGTLASNLKNQEELKKSNIVKVKLEKKLSDNSFLEAKDFFRVANETINSNIFHHVGIYAFTKNSLNRFVKLKRSKKEIERNLEQMRALENGMLIKVAYNKSNPLSVDTEEDLIQIRKEII